MTIIIRKLSKWYFNKKALPYWVVLLLNCVIVLFSGYVGLYIELGGLEFAHVFWSITCGLLLSLIPFIVAFCMLHTYTGIVRYSTFTDLIRIGSAILIGSIITLTLSFAIHDVSSLYMPGVLACCTMFVFSTFFMFIERVVVKSMYDTFRINDKTQKVFIYGVHAGGVALAKSIHSQEPLQYKVVGFVTPDEDLYSKHLMGVLVRHDSPRLVEHMQKRGATILIVSPLQNEHFRLRQDLISDLLSHNIRIMMIPDAEEWDGKTDLSHHNLREVEIEDLLPRKKIEVDMDAIAKMLTGKRILITGAAGSIGSDIARQVAKFNPFELILVDQAETPMHDIRLYMACNHKAQKVLTIVGSICNQKQMETLFRNHTPEYVFHAAAYKHVPMMEDNPAMAVQNNIYGTRVIADLSVKYGTKKFVMISTDKAVNPTNVMGCSKRICEIYCQALNAHQQKTQFVTTRFGNVLGSNGSVIPIFKEQIKRGGPVMVTHPDIIRYFMLIPEACRLVLEAGTMGKGGEIFVFDMGQPVKIVDLAKRMITLSGAKNIEIKFSGLRDGEKLYEELLATKENSMPTPHPKIKVAKVREYPYELVLRNEIELYKISESFDDIAIVKKMKEIVPEYKSEVSKYKILDN
ncbi:MAG: polysaccharide biosynthesis protein [Bacteroidales bacterium]|nr:polysaccharide biosynthesis protein [Bacteroidales bacterium]MCF0190035.1 polysaccharide biosynthesis protein [Marinilabiliaceae bacterium]